MPASPSHSLSNANSECVGVELTSPHATPPATPVGSPAIPAAPTVLTASSSVPAVTALAPAPKRFKKRTGTTRERTGCLTCRQRRKKCDDNTYPICGHCRRLNLECVRESPRPLVLSPKSSQSTELLVGSSSNCPGDGGPGGFGGEILKIPEPLVGQGWRLGDGSDRRYLLKYYTQVLSGLVTTNHENNSFLSVFIPMAYDSPPLLSSLIAWSSAHLSCFQPSYTVTTLEKQSVAFRSVASSIALPYSSLETQETNLAATLVLCSTDVVFGDTGQWHKHLVGARDIIISARRGNDDTIRGPRALMGTLDGEWLLRNFAFHDVLGSVLRGSEPLIKGAYWLRDGIDVVDSYIGVGSRILAFISEISYLQLPSNPANQSQDANSNMAANASRYSHDPFYDAGTMTPVEDIEMDDFFNTAPAGPLQDFWAESSRIEEKLLAWTCPAAVQPGLVPLAEAYRSAALLYLYRKRRAYLSLTSLPPSSTTFPSATLAMASVATAIAASVSSILTHLSHIPLTSLPETGMLFPLFMAGGDTLDPSQIEVVRMRLRAMIEYRGFGNIRRASEVLEELWRARASGVTGVGGGVLDWMDVLGRRGWLLMLT